MTTLNNQSNNFVSQLAHDYPQFSFKQAKQDHWSPASQTIFFNPSRPIAEFKQSLLHELAHALLGHQDYSSDIELLRLEAAAWELAAKIAPSYDLSISNEHIQDCLDTYRDWLHRRSTCPTCGVHVLQSTTETYRCFNCQTTWSVSSERFVRAYRKAN